MKIIGQKKGMTSDLSKQVRSSPYANIKYTEYINTYRRMIDRINKE